MKKPLSQHSDSAILLQLLAFTNKRVSGKLEDVYATIGLKKSSYEVLAALLNASPTYALTPNELLEITHITSGTMTTRIDKLTKKGWVERLVNKKDKRSVRVSLTSTGKTLIEEAVQEHDKAVQKILSAWTEKDQQQLTRILSKMNKQPHFRRV